MKIAVTSKGKDLDSDLDPRFGRASYILVIDTDTFEYEVIDNSENANAFKGAGIQAAASVSDKKAQVLLTGFCGPNAFKTLNAAGVRIADNAKGTVKEAVQDFLDGKIKYAASPNTDGHW
ncbi:MAG: NifB/NifX family molybdenum-iron cluster-binding protein [Desulfobacteraceae bacterium]